MMRLRKMFIAASAIVAAGALAVGPSAMASTTVGGSTTGTHAVNLTMQSVQVIIKIYGINTTINCTAGSESGAVTAGTGNAMTINTVYTNCPSIMPGTTVTMSTVCNIAIPFSGGMTAGVDTAVTGTEALTNGTPADCVQVSISNGCMFKVGGSVGASFNETPVVRNGVTYQDLTLSGNPTIKNPNAACLGMITNGQTFSLNAVFIVQSPDGLINYY